MPVDVTFRCGDCKQKFESREALYKHMAAEHPQKKEDKSHGLGS